jgi:hypothetical protein
VVPARLGNRRNRRQLRAGRILNSLASSVPVEVPLKQLISGLVKLSALLSSRHLSAVIATGDLDVESLGPELPFAHIAVVVDRHDLRAQNVVSARDLAGDLDALRVLVVVEDGVSAPVAGLALGLALGVAPLAIIDQSGLVDLEELEVRLLDVFAVTVARGEVCGGPTVVGAVPAGFSSAA